MSRPKEQFIWFTTFLLLNVAVAMPINKSEHSASKVNLRPEYLNLQKMRKGHGTGIPSPETSIRHGQKWEGNHPSAAVPTMSMTPAAEFDAMSTSSSSRTDTARPLRHLSDDGAEPSQQNTSSGGGASSSSRSPSAAVYKPPHIRRMEAKGTQNKNFYMQVSAITHPGDKSAYTNADKKPSQERLMPFLYEQNPTQAAKCSDFDEQRMGKWMMFFDMKNELDDKWTEAKRLYNEGKLEGIISMKVSTAYENPRASDGSKGVLIFYCGPCTDEAKMMDIGRKLIIQIPYKSNMYYKADWQTTEGTRATGVKKNSLYTVKPSSIGEPK